MSGVLIRCGNCDTECWWSYMTGQDPDRLCDCEDPYLIPAGYEHDGTRYRTYPYQERGPIDDGGED